MLTPISTFRYALDLEPATFTDGYHNESMESWGGQILKGDDSTYHLWASAFAVAATLVDSRSRIKGDGAV